MPHGRLSQVMMAGVVHIRPITVSDAAAVAELTTQLGYPTSTNEMADRIAAVAASAEDSALLVAVDDHDEPIGWAHVARLRLLERPPSAQLNGLVVDERHRSKGIGASLLRAAEAWACERGLFLMLIRSRTSREAAHTFYEREGYRVAKTSYTFEKRLE